MRVTGAQLKKVIDLYPEPQQRSAAYTGTAQRLDVKAYLGKYGIECAGIKDHKGSTLYLLKHCIFDPSHEDESAIGQTPEGKLFYQCFHNSCQDRTWKEARQAISGNEPLFLDSNRKQQIAADSTRIAPDSTRKHLDSIWIASGEQTEQIAPMVRQFIENGSGKFITNDVTTHSCAINRRDKQCVYLELNKLKKAGKIRKIDHEMNSWEVIEPDTPDMDLEADTGEPVNIPLPLDISDMVNVYPGSVVLISGTSNAGKTAFLLSILNKVLSGGASLFFLKKEWKEQPAGQKQIRYLNCEMGTAELKKRLIGIGTRPVSEWTDQVSFKERHRLFHQLVLPDGLTFIDYLDVTEDFFEAPHLISQIHEKLDTGIAIVAMQKAPDRQYAIGGAQTIAKPRLVINLDNNEPYGMIAQLVKVKEPVDFRSKPQGKEIDFQVTPACEFQSLSGWRFVNQKQRQTINAQYQRELDTPDKTDHWEKF